VALPRPIFLNDRLFALMGYELVEGRAASGLAGDFGRAFGMSLMNSRHFCVARKPLNEIAGTPWRLAVGRSRV